MGQGFHLIEMRSQYSDFLQKFDLGHTFLIDFAFVVRKYIQKRFLNYGSPGTQSTVVGSMCAKFHIDLPMESINLCIFDKIHTLKITKIAVFLHFYPFHDLVTT